MLNDIKIHGYLGRDPELIEYTNAKGETGHLVSFSVGVSRDMGDETDWFDVTFFGRRAEVIEKFFSKGSQIIVTGRMQSDSYEKDGQTVYTTDVFCSKVHFLEWKNKKDNQAAGGIDQAPAGFSSMDEDIPF